MLAAGVGLGVAAGAGGVAVAVAATAAGAGVGVAAFALAAGAAVAALPLSAVLAGVCALAAGAIEINPANAVNQKALLRRITTLSRLRITKEVPGFPDTKKRRTDGAPSSSAASSSDAAFPPSRIFAHRAGAAQMRGHSPPVAEKRHDLAPVSHAKRTPCGSATRAFGPLAADRIREHRPAARPRHRSRPRGPSSAAKTAGLAENGGPALRFGHRS